MPLLLGVTVNVGVPVVVRLGVRVLVGETLGEAPEEMLLVGVLVIVREGVFEAVPAKEATLETEG